MNSRITCATKAIFSGALLLLISSCVSLPSHLVGHYQGHWEVGEAYEGFTSLDGKLVCSVDMPAAYNDYFLRRSNPVYHTRNGSFFSAAYVDIDGYVTSADRPAVGSNRWTLHVTRVHQVLPATAAYIKQRTAQEY